MIPPHHITDRRLIAVDPVSRGFGFVVLEGPSRLIDWGVAHVKTEKHKRCLQRIVELTDHYQPDVLVTENPAATGSRRCARVEELIGEVRHLARQKRIASRQISRTQIRRAFPDVDRVTKREIAVAVTQRFPQLLPHLPQPRKPWMSEDQRMAIFDAASFGLAYLYSVAARRCSRALEDTATK